MSTFDMVLAKLECPNTKKVADTWIQIKFRPGYRDKTYKINNKLDDLWPEYNNAWIQADYVCEQCSPRTKGKYNRYIKTQDQVRHNSYLNIQDSRLLEVLTEKEFKKREIPKFVVYE